MCRRMLSDVPYDYYQVIQSLLYVYIRLEDFNSQSYFRFSFSINVSLVCLSSTIIGAICLDNQIQRLRCGIVTLPEQHSGFW
jgi:hypothetical protein